jgi:hypothetical protein
MTFFSETDCVAWTSCKGGGIHNPCVADVPAAFFDYSNLLVEMDKYTYTYA